jgi:hypothetical protein
MNLTDTLHEPMTLEDIGVTGVSLSESLRYERPAHSSSVHVGYPKRPRSGLGREPPFEDCFHCKILMTGPEDIPRPASLPNSPWRSTGSNAFALHDIWNKPGVCGCLCHGVIARMYLPRVPASQLRGVGPGNGLQKIGPHGFVVGFLLGLAEGRV